MKIFLTKTSRVFADQSLQANVVNTVSGHLICFGSRPTLAFVPDVWMNALITPVHKKGPTDLVANYRLYPLLLFRVNSLTASLSVNYTATSYNTMFCAMLSVVLSGVNPHALICLNV